MIKTNLRGILTDIFPTDTISERFTKRVFWVKEPDREQYPQHWEVELHNDDAKQINKFEVGDHVEVEVELRGKQYTRRGSYSKAIVMSLKAVGLKLLARPGDDTYPTVQVKMTPKPKPTKDESQGELPL
jgi:hypothetical protein